MARGKPELDRERCKGCELCIPACPVQILTMSEDFNSQGHHYAICFELESCTGCQACAIICPDSAIEVWLYPKAS